MRTASGTHPNLAYQLEHSWSAELSANIAKMQQTSSNFSLAGHQQREEQRHATVTLLDGVGGEEKRLMDAQSWSANRARPAHSVSPTRVTLQKSFHSHSHSPAVGERSPLEVAKRAGRAAEGLKFLEQIHKVPAAGLRAAARQGSMQ
mmetsp:Transcript_21556/g.51890  ORF Transcript_21556/g.51890 Transcript_21556/m.51890 type:complete len:147 (+) Transcript_21556:53-493(+)